MRTWMKVVVGAVLVGVVTLAVAGWATFGDLAPEPAGEELGALGYAGADGYVGFAVLDGGPGALVLIDAGNDPMGAAVLGALAAHHQSADDVAAIFLTHGHPDHAGGAHLFPHAKVYAMAEELPYATGKAAYLGPVPRLFGPVDTGVGQPTGLTDGSITVVGALSVEGLLVPGHTAGSAAWLVGDTLFLGDSVSAAKDGHLVGAPWIFSDDTAENVVSVCALAQRLAPRAASIHRIVTSHTGSLTGFGPLAAFTGE